MDRPGAQGPRGSQQTGSDRPCGLPAPPPADPRKRKGRGQDMNHPHATRPPARPRGTPSARPSFRLFRFLLLIFWPVALAGLSHPFPSRTRTLRAPAAMVLRPGAWESSAPPVFFPGPRPLTEAGGLFFRSGQSQSVSMRARLKKKGRLPIGSALLFFYLVHDLWLLDK